MKVKIASTRVLSKNKDVYELIPTKINEIIRKQENIDLVFEICEGLDEIIIIKFKQVHNIEQI